MDRIVNSPARRSPMLEAVLNGLTGRIGASLVVICWAINSARRSGPIHAG